MNGVRLVLRMSLGGAVCGSFLGIFTGGLLAIIYGGLTGNVSLGLDGALVGGGVGCLGGAIGGVFLTLRDGKTINSKPAPIARSAKPDKDDVWPTAMLVQGLAETRPPETRHLSM